MAKVILALLGCFVGLLGGAMFGASVCHALFGTSSHMDASGLVGALFGAPIGAFAGLVLGLAAGWIVDRRTGGRVSGRGWKRIGIATVAGAVLGVLLTALLQNAPWHIIGICLGLLIGCGWNAQVEGWRGRSDTPPSPFE
jgi:MFS family permease